MSPFLTSFRTTDPVPVNAFIGDDRKAENRLSFSYQVRIGEVEETRRETIYEHDDSWMRILEADLISVVDVETDTEFVVFVAEHVREGNAPLKWLRIECDIARPGEPLASPEEFRVFAIVHWVKKEVHIGYPDSEPHVEPVP